MKYENKELLLAKLEAINVLSAEAAQMIKELFSEDEGLTPPENISLPEIPVEDTPVKDEPVADSTELEEPKVEEGLNLEIYSKDELIRVLSENFKVKVPKNSSRDKVEGLVENLVAEYGKSDVEDILREYRKIAKEMQPFAPYICDGKKSCLDCHDLRECYQVQNDAMIDDDGVKHPMGEAYFVNDKLCCCGFNCEEDGGVYKCAVCGEEYELE